MANPISPMGAAQSPGISPMGDAAWQPAEVPLAPPEPEQEEDEQSVADREEEVAWFKRNLAKKKDEKLLATIGDECYRGFDADLQSMQDWLDQNEEWSKLARQVREEKTFPWPKASNIKYPLISTAALQFNARAYPSLVPADKKIVKTRIYGKDPTGQKREKGDRISTYMSWQFSEDMDWWEEDMDRLLIMNSVVGQSYKKSYYDPSCDKVVSHLVYAENFIVDKWVRSLECAPRYTEIHCWDKNKIEELKLRDFFLKEVDLGPPTSKRNQQKRADDTKDANDFTLTYEIGEQHTWLDLDNDNLREPYIVWFDINTKKVLRIQARFDKAGIKTAENDKGKEKVVGYEAKTYYTKFGFIPNPDGSFLDLGFGNLLGPINEAVNTNINQLTDAGTTRNLQAGFISKGLKLDMKDDRFGPGEWKRVAATGDDLRKLIVPLPTNEPSAVLFQLLGMLIQAGKELASVAEIFTGKMPGQNTPATTTQATIEQGMKVFTAIYKRIYRSLDAEFKKIFYLNKYYLDKDTYVAVLDESIGPDDFDDETYDICPSADPTATTQGEKLQKAMMLVDLVKMGLIPPEKVLPRLLEAQEQPNWQELVPGMMETGQPAPPEPKIDPKLAAQQQKAQIDEQIAMKKDAREERKFQMEMQGEQTRLMMEKEDRADQRAHEQQMNQLQLQKGQATNEIFMAEAQAKAIQGVQQGEQKLRHNEDVHKQKLQQSKEIEKSKPSPKKTSKSGKPTR